MKYQNSNIEPRDVEDIVRRYGTFEEYRRIRPDYHLYEELSERLPKYVRIVEKLKDIKELPLNDKGLPF